MIETAFDRRIADLRRFNRFYTQKIGMLQEALLSSPFSLTEARVLYELACEDHLTATQLGKKLGLDPGYLSRILRGFERRGLIRRTPSSTDRRFSLLSLTAQGLEAFAPLDASSHDQIGAILHDLSEDEQIRLVAMHDIVATPRRSPHQDHPPEYRWTLQRHLLYHHATQREAEHVAGRQPEAIQERQGMYRHTSDRIGHRPARPTNAGAIEQNHFSSDCKGVGDRWIPIVHRSCEVLKAQERQSRTGSETPVRIFLFAGLQKAGWGGDVARNTLCRHVLLLLWRRHSGARPQHSDRSFSSAFRRTSVIVDSSFSPSDGRHSVRISRAEVIGKISSVNE